MAKSSAFQLTTEEERMPPNVVKGMYSILISLFVLIIADVYFFVYRIFLSERYISFGIV